MKTTQKTLTPGTSLNDYIDTLKKNGFKGLGLWDGSERVPNGTKEKVIIHIRRWCGEWSGWQTFKKEFVYYR